MTPHLSLSHVTLLVGGAVLAGGILLITAYVLHKTFQRRRQGAELQPKPPRVEDENAFAMATLQGVIARMKAQEKELVSLRLAAEQRAKESARISENLIREMPSGVLVFNREGFITTANPAVRAILNVDTWSRRRFPEVLGPGSALADFIRECLEAGKTMTRETIEYSTPAGEARILGMSLSPFHAPSGKIDGAVCLVTDLTEIRRLQEQIRLKEHLAALGAMSAGIAHEFKNSLATISGYAQLLRDARLSDEERAFAEKIVREIRSLTQVVTDFLAVSKPLQITARSVNVLELFRQLIDDLRRIDVFTKTDFKMDGEFPEVEGDEVLLRQAFSNLLRNACEALPAADGHGWVCVRGELSRREEGDFAKILISDSGGGISPPDQQKIFLPFYTTKPAGMGLGLALAQRIVLSHNGTVSLEDSSPQGTTFAVSLPLRIAGSPSVTPPAAA